MKICNYPIFRKKRFTHFSFTLEDYDKLDETLKMIPLSFKPALLNMHFYKDIVKKFLIVLAGLNNSYFKEGLYYGKDVFCDFYSSHLVRTSILITFDDSNNLHDLFFNYDISLVWNFIRFDDRGEDTNSIHQYILNVDGANKDLTLKNSNECYKDCGVFVRNVNYYRKKYLDGECLEPCYLILVLFTVKTFRETYEIISKIFNKEDADNFMQYVIQTSQNSGIKKQYRQYMKVR